MKKTITLLFTTFLSFGISAQFSAGLDYMMLSGTMVKDADGNAVTVDDDGEIVETSGSSAVLNVSYTHPLSEKLDMVGSVGYGMGFGLIPLKASLSYGVSSSISANLGMGMYMITDDSYNPYPSNIYIHNNIYKRDKQFPAFSFTMPIGFILAYNFWRDVPDIIYDGILDPDKINESGELFEEHKICIIDNINAQMSNIDAGNDFLNISTDIEEFNCSHDRINPIYINN